MSCKQLLAPALLWIAVLPCPFAAAQQPGGPAAAPAAQKQSDLIAKYCFTCHNDKLKTGGLTLENRDLSKLSGDADVWEKVVRKLRGGMMPPVGMPRPDPASTDALVSYLTASLDRAAAAHPDPGPALLRRLNRSEYANAIRDLLKLDVDVSSLLPADDSSYGFDNIADVLRTSPLLLERYVSAAEKISALAVGDPKTPAGDDVYQIPLSVTQTQHIEGLPLGTRGGTLIRYNFPLDGEYAIKVRLFRGNVGFIRGLAFPHEVEISIDGERVHLATVGGTSDYQVSLINPTEANDSIDGRLRIRIPVKAGPHSVAVAFVQKTGGPTTSPDALQPFLSAQDPVDMNGIPTIDRVTVSGPFNPTGPGSTPSRKAIFTCRANREPEELTCAREIFGRLARTAYRRPVNDFDLQPLLSLYRTGRQGQNFDAGIQMGLEGILTSPSFVFRPERDAETAADGAIHRVTDLELASRLSFFLWSSVPDEQLLALAAQGRLSDPPALEKQVRRMLADPRSEALVSNFAGQWLHLRNLKAIIPSFEEFPDFDDNLRQAFRTETEMLFASMIHEDRNVVDLLTANYTFVNERLARHYHLPGIYGSEFRRIPITDERRYGLLGQGSILMVNSYANRTSPVLRGKWILENVIGSAPPPPPPNVPALKDNVLGHTLTVRERMAEHRASPACSSCHRIMDPLGFSLENFDAVGAWRTQDSGVRIDSADILADGTKVDGPVALRNWILRRPENFVNTVTEKLMIYALGRGLIAQDEPAVRKIVADAAPQQYRFSAIVMGIVNSVPFQMRAKPAASGETSASNEPPSRSLARLKN